MKVTIFKLVIITLTIITACTCSDNNDSEANPPYNNSYIQKFTDVTQISAKADFGVSVKEIDKIVNFHTGVTFTPKDLHILVEVKSANGFYSADDPQTTNGYKEYCRLISTLGDTAFTTTNRYYGVLDNTTSIAITETLSSVVVTCDKVYGNIPANTSLNDLITVVFDNPYVIVKNNYKNYEGTDSYAAYNIRSENFTENFKISDFPYAFVGGNLSLMDWETKSFIGNKLLFIFNKSPDTSDTYTFKIKVVKLNGEILEATTQPINL